MRKYLLVGSIVLAAASPARADPDPSRGFGFISTAASGPQCAAVNLGIGMLGGFSFGNFTTTGAVLTFFDSALANTSTAAKSYPFVIPATGTANQGAGSNITFPFPITFVNAISFCINTIAGNNSGSSGLIQGTIDYQ